MSASASAAAGADPAVPARLVDRLRTPLVQLNLLGVVLVAVAIVPARIGPITIAAGVIGTVALAAWVVWVLCAHDAVRTVALLTCAAVAAVGAGLGSPSLIAPVIASLVVTVSDTARPPRTLIAPVVVTTLALVVTSAAHGQSLLTLLSFLAAVAFGVLGGYSRRQRNTAEERRRAGFTASLAAEREAERARLLEARSAAARDVHDVLAHSLGGLVVQLDAIEALLEHGRVDEAATRAAAARRLAGEGLAEARRAVAVLRDPAATAPVDLPDDALAALVATHRALGGTIEVDGDPSLRGFDDAHRLALAGALREALVNARRHAPGADVQVGIRREARAMVLRVTNPLAPADGPSVGDGHGLAGMRERFAALGDGSVATAGADSGTFVVEMRAVVA